MIREKKNRQTIRLPCPRSRQVHQQAQALRFTPYAWAKLLFLRDLGSTEVGGFGISAPNDLLLIEDVVLIRQTCSAVTVQFDDASVADFFDSQVDLGRRPEQFARIWIHTHPGSSPSPSLTDEATFSRCFGATDWALMFILACGGRAYARLRFQAGPRGELILPVEVAFNGPFPAAAVDLWTREYEQCVVLERSFGDLREPLFSVAAAEHLVDAGLAPFERAFDLSTSLWNREPLDGRFDPFF